MRQVILAFLILCSSLVTLAQEKVGGLLGEYYNGANFEYLALTRIDKDIGFSRKLESPCPGVGKEYFSIRWSGSLQAPLTGTYFFHVLADDGVRVWVDHELLIDAWYDQEAAAYSGSILLEAGETYDIKIEYYNSIIHSVIDVRWQIPNVDASLPGLAVTSKESKIPANYLKPSRVEKRPKFNVMLAEIEYTNEQKPEDIVEQEKPFQKIRQTDSKKVAIKTDEPIVLKTVIFEQQRSELLPDSYDELNELIAYLKRHKNKKIEIRGHTDYAGDSLDNHHLSIERAKAVEHYLVKGGVAKERIISKGFGGSQPVVTKKDIEDRLMNRRVEFVLTD